MNFLNINFTSSLIDLTYFNVKYFDALEGWKGNTQAGSGSTTANSPSTTKSQGLEFVSKWKKSEKLDFDVNFTHTSTYDGAEQDDPDKNEAYTDARMVRVPRNIINLATNFKDANDSRLPTKSKLGNKSSDIVGELQINPNKYINFDYNFFM
jgi:hypothetical protein